MTVNYPLSAHGVTPMASTSSASSPTSLAAAAVRSKTERLRAGDLLITGSVVQGSRCRG